MSSLLSGNLDELLEAIRSSETVAGLTHRFYRYPARFSPRFARSAIEQFTNAGDVVLDPFMGGGTTIVEALSAGRKCIGSDINPLSEFITRVKTTPLSKSDVNSLLDWGHLLKAVLTLR